MEHPLELETAHVGLETLRVPLDVAGCALVVLGFGELEELCRVGDALGGAVELADLRAQLRPLAAQLLGALGLGPDARVLELAADLLEALFLDVVLKETP
jgi:hypothetical protein